MILKLNQYLAILILVTLVTGQQAFAISPPEPQSGGKFFALKGTQAGDEYAEYTGQDYFSSGYARTETGAFERSQITPGLRFGSLQVRPSIGYTGEFDSNIFLTEDDTKSDYISRLLGGVDFLLPVKGGQHLLMAGVQSKSEWFAKNSDADNTDWAYQAGAKLNFSKFNIAVHEDFRDTTDRSDSELTQRIQRYENRLTGLLEIPLGRFFSETEVSDFWVNFRDNNAFENFDRHELSFYPRFGFNVGAKTQALVEYGYTNIWYDNNDERDGAAHQAQFGLRGYLGESNLLSYQIWGGWQIRNYDSGRFNDFSGVVGRGELVYTPTVRDRLSAGIIRRPEESTVFGQSYFVRNELTARYQRQIAESWFAHVRGAVGLSDYSTDREDFLWEPAVGLEYVLPGKRFALFSEYRFSARESDAQNNDYNRHIVQFGIKAQA